MGDSARGRKTMLTMVLVGYSQYNARDMWTVEVRDVRVLAVVGTPLP
jgi:hypothetical protein